MSRFVRALGVALTVYHNDGAHKERQKGLENPLLKLRLPGGREGLFGSLSLSLSFSRPPYIVSSLRHRPLGRSRSPHPLTEKLTASPQLKPCG